MDEQTVPHRASGRDRIRDILGDHLGLMESVVASRRISLNGDPTANGHRTLKKCAAVLIWEEADGSESTEVIGEGSPLLMKGMLHDGIYLLAHQGEEGFAPR